MEKTTIYKLRDICEALSQRRDLQGYEVEMYQAHISNAFKYFIELINESEKLKPSLQVIYELSSNMVNNPRTAPEHMKMYKDICKIAWDALNGKVKLRQLYSYSRKSDEIKSLRRENAELRQKVETLNDSLRFWIGAATAANKEGQP